MTIAWICGGLMMAMTPMSDLAPPPDLVGSYQDARAKAGRSPEAQVRLALWCEAHGLTAERLHHLTLAVLADPKNAAARGMMGLVSHEGRWTRPERIADKAKLDPTLSEYESRRQKAPYTADAQWSLAVWAEEVDLREQARVHLIAVTRLDPSREAAWKKLGYKKHDGRWRTDAQVAADKAEVEAQKLADQSWTAQLARWRGWLDVPDRRIEAELGLDGLADPRAVGSVVKVFAAGGPNLQAIAVRLLGQIDSPGSSRALAYLATWGGSADVRRASAEVLKHRDPRESLGMLIGGFRQTIRYELGVSPNSAGAMVPYLAIEGKNYDFVLNSTRPMANMAVPARLFDNSVPFNPGGLPGYGFGSAFDAVSPLGLANLPGGAVKSGNHSVPIDPANALVDKALYAASLRDEQIAQAMRNGPVWPPNFKAQASEMMAQIDNFNGNAIRDNAAIYDSLGLITGQILPLDPDAWKKWWVDSLGYSYQQSTQTAQTITSKPVYGYTIVSCFAAGTPVRTLTGDRAIESLRVGDQVLSQDTATGSLRYRTIAKVHHNPPAMALRVKLGGEVILATGFHRFWKAGQGWVMARELKPGDAIRTLDGPVRVESVEPDRVQPVFNLDVADDADFFVGKLGTLVHDNSLPDPRLAPFDAPAPGSTAQARRPDRSVARP